MHNVHEIGIRDFTVVSDPNVHDNLAGDSDQELSQVNISEFASFFT